MTGLHYKTYYKQCYNDWMFQYFIKIMARNIFYELLKIFRPMYDNFRDDCAILRELTRLSGLVMKKGNVICINLWSQADYPKKNLEVIEQFISTMTFFINAHLKIELAKFKFSFCHQA